MATAGVKISSLRELTTAEDADYIVINDVSASTTKKISRANFLKDITNDSGGGGTLDGLTDTSIESPASGDFLRYFPNNQTWRNVSFSPTFASIYEQPVTNQPVTNNGADKARFENIWQNASTVLTVTANGSSAYRFDQYLITGTNVPTTDNPTIYVQAGTTIGFDLSYDAAGDNPFKIQTTAGVDVSDGILEVTSRNVYTDFTQGGAYGGTLYWKVPASYTGNYKYQCTTHSGMTGTIVVEAVDGGGGGGGSLPSRTSPSQATSSIANGASANIDITGFKGYALYTITTSAAAWVTLYTDGTARTADASRGEGTDPTPDAGVIAEVITTGAQTVRLSPGTIGYNLESTPTTNIPVTVRNKSGSAAVITVALEILQLEA